MNPSQKDPEFDRQLTALFGFDRRTNITADKCCPPPHGCGGDASFFNDELSRREFSISGLCQQCQDITFQPHPEDDSDTNDDIPF